ncbi:MAG TPA: hypothetical protein VNO82_15565 [Solirubrobacteraceae bacterium]|nr:hypothetical protein [Solirubrobacteraceae bacterium]
MLAAVQAGDIFEVVWASLLAGVFVSTAFSFVVLGMARSAESARRGHGTAAIAYAGLAVIAFAMFAFAVGYGVHIMLSKS